MSKKHDQPEEAAEDDAAKGANAAAGGGDASEGYAEAVEAAGDPGASGGEGFAGGDEPPSPEMRIAELEAERNELRDRLMRALAEAENSRKRAERDRKDAETYGGTKLARDLLAVHDNLGRALQNVDAETRKRAAAFIEGVELTQRELLNAFAKHRIEPVEPEKGERFDPKLHQAMFEAPSDEAAPGAIIQVMQPGFVIADRLLRPALVGVAAARPAGAEKQAETGAETGAEAGAEGGAGS